MNKLFYGDNLTIMKGMPDNSVDLIYLDPPFNSNRNYNLLYSDTTGFPVPESVEAFCDTWDLDYEKEDLAKQMPVIMRQYGIQEDIVEFWYYWIKALKETQPKMLAYLVYMSIRLVEMHRILKATGSIYLHCDTTASHYLKIMMDGIFGHDNFRNEIVWCYKGPSAARKNFPGKHDIILRYSMSSQYFFDTTQIKIPYDEKTLERRKYAETQKKGIPFHGKDMSEYMQGRNPYDWWDDIPSGGQISKKEILGYPTQKPLALLDRIIKASCPKDGIVLDPFCGCGTTIEAAIQNQVDWIGIDIAIHSINLIEKRRLIKYPGIEYQISGIPQSEEQAKYLFEQDPFQFQHWAIEKTGGFCNNKKTADRGVDGKIYFEAEGKKLKNMVLSVKGGNIKPADIRDLRGVLERDDDTEMAGFISIHTPSKAMMSEADSAGVYTYKGVNYPRIQLITIKEIFEGRFWHCPSVVKIEMKEGGQTYLAL